VGRLTDGFEWIEEIIYEDEHCAIMFSKQRCHRVATPEWSRITPYRWFFHFWGPNDCGRQVEFDGVDERVEHALRMIFINAGHIEYEESFNDCWAAYLAHQSQHGVK
jgi:hypothetical protein